MKLKPILSGVFAFAIASGTVLAFNEELRIPNGAYELNGQCFAVNAPGCDKPVTDEECTIEVGEQELQLRENTGTEQNPVCGQELFRIME